MLSARSARCVAVLWLAVAQSAAAAVCDTDTVGTLVQQTLPQYSVMRVGADNGIVTLLLARRSGVGTLAVAVRASGTKLFTETMVAQLDEVERARTAAAIAGWYDNQALRQTLANCDVAGGAPPDDSDDALRKAAEAALATHDRVVDQRSVPVRKVIESGIVVAALLLAVALVVVPGAWRPALSTPKPETPALDLTLVLALAALSMAIAAAIAWRLGPEGDEVVTLGTRHGVFSYLLSWADGAEPFNPPGTPVIFALWLRLADGFFWARVLSIALIPLTAWCAYQAGRAAGGRCAGVSCTAMVVLGPAYLQLAAIARGYALLAVALCWLLAAIGRTKDAPSRGRSVGLASLLAVWTSYLLWPLALAAPWIARLERGHRLRLSAALGLMATALAPRVVNGFGSAMGKTDVAMFGLQGPRDAFGYALAMAGLAAPANAGGARAWFVPAAAVAAVLVFAALVLLWRSDRRQARDAGLVLALLAVPVLALLAGGHGIRDRHVLGMHLGLTWCAATGLGGLIASPGWRARLLGGLAAGALIGIAAVGNHTVLAASTGWIDGLAELGAQADLLVIVPRDAQFEVYAMLTGDVPLGSETVRWPPVCPSGTEWWCRRVGRLQTVSVDAVTDEVVAAAAVSPRTIWIYKLLGASIPGPLRACRSVLRNATWSVFDCRDSAPHPN